MGGWSVTCYFYRYYLQRQGVLVSPWLENIAFHLRPIWLQTLVMIESESCQTSFPSFFSPPSEVAVLLNWNLSRRPFLGHRRASGRVRSAPLHRIRFGTCFFCLPQTVFYLGKPIESSFQLFLANSFKLFSANRFNLFSAVPYFYSEINGWSKDWVKRWARLWTSQPLVGNNFSPIPLKILFHIKKESDSLRPVGPKLTKHLNLFDSQLSQYCKSCSTFSSEASRSRPSATVTISGTPCLCTRPELCRSAVPRDRSFKTFNCLWNSLLEWLPNDRQGLELRLNLNSAAWRPWPMGCKGAICSDTKRMAKPFQAKFLTHLL